LLHYQQRLRTGIARSRQLRTIRNIPRKGPRARNGQKDMESSRRYLLQAEIEYWHEMLRINRDRLTDASKQEMRNCLKAAMQALNAGPAFKFRSAA